ncbi:MAG: ion transporter [Phaeodactylibacter sp.]|nr:ion transporter [Phaeodactylibacter sp.]MCB9051509.1 ion transporter [Lewinellaceae bacterium]
MPTSQRDKLKEKIHEIIFEADTTAGKAFDIGLLLLIMASVLVVMLESVQGLQARYSDFFYALEWTFTIIFSIEYLLRLYCVYRPAKYAGSFFGIIDLLAILPTYISLIIYGTQYLLVIRALRLLRVFRIFKLGHFLSEGETIVRALKASRAKITVFLTFILLLVIIIGSVMYLVEGGQNEDFSSIPRAIYWTIVTLTTVGYGDITPATGLGQFLSAFIMLLGYAILAVPTGIVSAEMVATVSKAGRSNNTQACRYCGGEGHADDAVYCKYCGERLN